MDKLLLTLIAILLPFVGPAVAAAIKGASTGVILACLVLGICFHLPGVILALIVIWREDLLPNQGNVP